MSKETVWHSTNCILCSTNCGLQVQIQEGHLVKIRGDKSNPRSRGYTCEKPAQLDRYQNHADRLTSPLRRRPDGGFEEIDWDTAITEVSAKLHEIRQKHGGEKIMYYGGGGQGNHLGGAYSSATRRALGMRYQSNALAQEKTGEFWVERQMFGARPEPDFENAEVAVFIGKNPWHSHGFERARVTLREISKDPQRSMIVIDPRRTETADLADHFLQVRPGTDAFLLAAMLGVLVQEDLIDHDFLDRHTSTFRDLQPILQEVDVAGYSQRAGVDPEQTRAAARRMGRAASVAVLEDLGIEMAPHSTLNSYLEKLLYVLTGHFGRPGTMNVGTHMGKLIGTGSDNRRSPVGGHRIITGLIPCNVIPDEILTDHPNRFRAMIIESGNPVHSLADSPRMRETLDALECVVVIDVAMTETARHADYILPAASQYEKTETTFFGGGFPEHVFQLRQPLFDSMPGTLTEPEIHSRLCRALGAYTDADLAELKAAAQAGPELFAMAFSRILAERPDLAAIMPVVLYETLGRTLPAGQEGAALLWAASQQLAASEEEAVRQAGLEGTGAALGQALFDALLEHPEGVVISKDLHAVSFERIQTEDGRIQLLIPELLEELQALATEPTPSRDDTFPFILAAGERRSNTANTIYRDPDWRRKDPNGALRISPQDAERVGVTAGGRVRISTKRGALETVVEITDTLQEGHITLPNGLGLDFPDKNGGRSVRGVPPNELTSSEDRDPWAGTPWHKHVRAQLEACD